MKSHYYLLSYRFLALFLLLLISCKKDNSVSDSPKGEAVPGNILPLIEGHHFEFNGYLTSGSSETKIIESESGFYASWTIFPPTALSTVFPASAVLPSTKTVTPMILDSVRVTGLITQPKVTPVFVYLDESSGEYYYLTNFGFFFRDYNIFESSSIAKVRSDSLRFIKLASPKAGTLNAITLYEDNFQSYKFSATTPATINLRIVGNFEKKENITLNVNGVDTTITTYYLTVTNIAKLGTLDPITSINAKFWLAAGIGPVQFFLAGDAEAPGSFRKLKAKNF